MAFFPGARDFLFPDQRQYEAYQPGDTDHKSGNIEERHNGGLVEIETGRCRIGCFLCHIVPSLCPVPWRCEKMLKLNLLFEAACGT